MRCLLTLVTLCFTFAVRADDAMPIRPTSQPAKPAGQMKAGLSPEKAAAAMTVPEEFTVAVFAGEPDVHQPVAFCIDDRGRLWVVEAYTYPQRHPEKGPVLPERDKAKGDKILIFEDADGDGKFDKRTVFMEGLNLVSGIEVGFGGVWVGAAPYLLFIPHDEKTDKPAGEPKILLDGWGWQDTHETLNNFIWGPDGWLYGCHGVFTHSRVGKPGTPDFRRVPINAGVWRYHPTKHVFEVFAEGTSNPWGLDYNDHGDFFVEACVIPHCFHIIQGARYLRQAGGHFNPHTYADIGTIVDHLHYLGANAHDGNNKSGQVGGGHAHCGLMCYLGGSWPEKYRGQLFMGNIHGKRLNMDVLKPKGSGYVASHGSDFLFANDEWARFVNLKYGPDGNVYLLDWYDRQACHHNDPGAWDRTNGRVYKVSVRGTKPVKGLDLQKCSDEELAAYQTHDNDWYVRHARRILQERAAGAPQRAAEIQKILLRTAPPKSATAAKQLRHLWALHAVGGLDSAACAKLLEDASAPEQLRAWAVQLALENGPPEPGFVSALGRAAKSDPSALVRRYIASGLQRLPRDQRPEIAAGLVSHADGADFNLPLLYWYAIEPIAETDPKAALALTTSGKIPLVLQFAARRIASTSSSTHHETLADELAKAVAAKDSKTVLSILRGMSEGFKGRRDLPRPASWTALVEQLGKFDEVEVRSLAGSISIVFGNSKELDALRAVLADPNATTTARQAAIATLVAARDKNLPSVLQKLLAEVPVRGDAIRGLAAFDDPKTPAAILDVWAALNTAERRDALNTLAARPTYAHALLDAITSKKLPPTDVPADIVRAMRNLSDSTVSAKVSQIWGVIRETAADRAVAIAAMRKKLAAPGAPDLSLGRAVFAKSCQQCHALYGIGGNVGPEITGANRSDLDYLLENILDPSAVIPKDYMPVVLRLANERTVTGFVKVDTGATLTVQTANETLVINKDDVEELRHSKTSMMPDDLLKNMSDEEVRALFGYLRNPRQVPMLATTENAKDFFNGKDLTGWVGDSKVWSVDRGEIVGKLTDSTTTAALVSETTAENFRLTFRVKVTPDKAIGRVRVRGESRQGGEIKGLLAGIGTGVWGKLELEETPGSPLQEGSERFVKPDDWNQYVIEVIDGNVRLTINGQPCSDVKEGKFSRRGTFALQLSAANSGEMRVKEVQLEILAAKR